MTSYVYLHRFLLPLAAFLAACTPSGSTETKTLCEELRKIDWRDSEQWRRAIDVAPFERVLPPMGIEDDAAMGDVIGQLEELVKPAQMSEQLRSELLKISKADFAYVHPAKTSLYFFGNTQGSAHCRYDVWAVEKGATLDPIDGPFHGDDCDASIHFGTFGGKPLILQMQYILTAPLEWVGPTTIEAVFGNPAEWGETCRIDLEVK